MFEAFKRWMQTARDTVAAVPRRRGNDCHADSAAGAAQRCGRCMEKEFDPAMTRFGPYEPRSDR
jgi:hypothetical protein